MPIEDHYVENLPDIYRDVLETYPYFNSTRPLCAYINETISP